MNSIAPLIPGLLLGLGLGCLGRFIHLYVLQGSDEPYRPHAVMVYYPPELYLIIKAEAATLKEPSSSFECFAFSASGCRKWKTGLESRLTWQVQSRMWQCGRRGREGRV